MVPFLITLLKLIVIFIVCWGIVYFGIPLAGSLVPADPPQRFVKGAVYLIALIVFLVAALPLIGVPVF